MGELNRLDAMLDDANNKIERLQRENADLRGYRERTRIHYVAMLAKLAAAEADTKLIQFLAEHVAVYSYGPGPSRFGFSFDCGHNANDSYRDGFRKSISKQMKVAYDAAKTAVKA